FSAYVRRVLDSPDTLMPKEYLDFGVVPKPMTGAEAFITHARQLAFNYGATSREVANLALLQELKQMHGPATAKLIFDQVRFVNDSKAPTTVSAEEQNPRSPNTFASAARVDDILNERKPA